MKIENTRVLGLEGSIIASRYPMMTDTPDEYEFQDLVEGIQTIVNSDRNIEELKEVYDNDFEEELKCLDRMKNLGGADIGSGHCNALKGIIVQADFTASQAFWLQHGRYNFADIVSSQSKMHRLEFMDIDKQCNKWVDQRQIEILKEYINLYNNCDKLKDVANPMLLRNGEEVKFKKSNIFQLVIYNCPVGLELTARITDNYLSIKNQYGQRDNHPLEDWSHWKEWAINLPYFKELTGIKE